MSKIIADHREDKGIIRELSKNNNIKLKQLISADYVIQSKDKDGNEQTVGIERKTMNDFLNSIIDKRLLTQLILLKENFNVPLLIIEGNENIYALRNFHPNAIRGMLASIAVDYQIPILQTKNYRDTANLIKIIAQRLEKPKKLLSLLKKKKPLTLKEQQEYIIESLPKIGPITAKSLLNTFKSVKAIFNASEKDLQNIEKIGPKKAEEIKKVIENLY